MAVIAPQIQVSQHLAASSRTAACERSPPQSGSNAAAHRGLRVGPRGVGAMLCGLPNSLGRRADVGKAQPGVARAVRHVRARQPVAVNTSSSASSLALHTLTAHQQCTLCVLEHPVTVSMYSWRLCGARRELHLCKRASCACPKTPACQPVKVRLALAQVVKLVLHAVLDAPYGRGGGWS